MNRRDFLGLIASVPLALAIPKPPKPKMFGIRVVHEGPCNNVVTDIDMENKVITLGCSICKGRMVAAKNARERLQPSRPTAESSHLKRL